jgi:hypothetical protein
MTTCDILPTLLSFPSQPKVNNGMITELSRFYAAGPKNIPYGIGRGNVLILSRLRL